MSIPGQQNFNTIPSQPSLRDLLNYHKREIKLELNCHGIGTIETFDSTTQTATATLNYTKTFSNFNSLNATQIDSVAYPILVDCPVVTLSGGLGYITFPILPGDSCLIFFNDRDIDNWYSTGAINAPPNTTRTHAFADAIILVGVRPQSNPISDYAADAVVVNYAGNTIKIESDQVSVTLATGVNLILTATGKLEIDNSAVAPTGGDLMTLLNTLFTDIQNATTTTMLGPQPLVMPTFAADLAKFQTFVG